jgi:hypothetical protein
MRRNGGELPRGFKEARLLLTAVRIGWHPHAQFPDHADHLLASRADGVLAVLVINEGRAIGGM